MTNFADRSTWARDNLDILRGFNFASVDLIYLDAPINSDQNFAAPVDCAAARVVLEWVEHSVQSLSQRIGD